jgi:GT2 family glycosyltransferase
MIDISIIIITCNSGQFIGDCLDSISFQKNNDSEVIIIDNNSTDKTLEIIKQKMPNVYLIKNAENLGFGKAVNQGIRSAKGRFILVLNDDITLGDNFLNKLKDILYSLPQQVGMLCPKIMENGSNIIDSTGLVLTTFRRFYDRGRGKPEIGQFDSQRNVFGPCAAAAIYKKEMLEQIKIEDEYFDEDFFLILEDFDIVWRAKNRGWGALFVPELICYHQGGISRKRSSLNQYYAFRNRYLLLFKNERTGNLWKLLLFALLYDLPRLIFFIFFNARALKALQELSFLIPKMLRKRRIAIPLNGGNPG